MAREDKELQALKAYRNLTDLDDVSRAEVQERENYLRTVDVPSNTAYDADYLCAIHRYLFRDMYEQAGKLRNTKMGRHGVLNPAYADAKEHLYPSAAVNEVLPELNKAFDKIANANWPELDRKEFAKKAARIYYHLHYAQPFLRGNDRTLKIFMEHVAKRSNFTLDFNQVDSDRWRKASLASIQQPGGQPYITPLTTIFSRLAVDRPRTADPTPAVGPEPPFQASYPHAPDASTSTGSPTPAKRPRLGSSVESGVGR